MSAAQSVFRFIFQSVGLGLIVAAIVILLLPYLHTNSPRQFNLSK